jgi:hypothetical protein
VDFPELLAQWFARWVQHPPSDLRVDLVRGPVDRTKRAAWLSAESDRALAVSTVLTGAEGLEPEIAPFLQACGPARPA